MFQHLGHNTGKQLQAAGEKKYSTLRAACIYASGFFILEGAVC